MPSVKAKVGRGAGVGSTPAAKPKSGITLHAQPRRTPAAAQASGALNVQAASQAGEARVPQCVLSIDIGGTHVKVKLSNASQERRLDSGPELRPQVMCQQVLALTQDWDYDAISMGYPGPVLHGKPLHDPHNLAPGWVGFDYAAALHRPLKIVNDAAMQALGSYNGGKLLFLGLGTGLGSAMIVSGIVEPMELAHLPYRKHTYEDYVGLRGLKKQGKKHWRREVLEVVALLQAALEPDEVVLGGGNAKLMKGLPQGVRLGDNANAFIGGFRLWDNAVNARPV